MLNTAAVGMASGAWAGADGALATAVSLIGDDDFPSAVYQFVPHTTIDEMEASLEDIAAMGFTAVQMGPIHPPGVTKFGDKRGSAYAPRDVTQVSPHLFAGVSPDAYLRGDYVKPDPAKGWAVLNRFTTKARELGLRVVGDIVLAHTSRDEDVVRAHTEMYGPDFYLKKETGAHLETGQYDPWTDIAPINHEGPARDRILNEYCLPTVRRMMDAGVSVFRADAAPRLPLDLWTQLIAGAREYAAAKGLQRPMFYAEVLGYPVETEVDFVRKGGFDAVTSSLRWWKDFQQPWLVQHLEVVRAAGGVDLAFLDSPDTARAAATYDGVPGVMRQLAIMAFMSSSMIVMAGTMGGEREQPSVFLEGYRPPARDFDAEAEGGNKSVRSALKELLAFKQRYPFLNRSAYMELIFDGGQIVRVRRTAGSEQVKIVANTGPAKATYYVPPGFRRGLIFGTNTWRAGETWVGASRPGDKPAEEILQYDLAPMGVAVFYRKADDEG